MSKLKMGMAHSQAVQYRIPKIKCFAVLTIFERSVTPRPSATGGPAEAGAPKTAEGEGRTPACR
ncbi:MAG: hypothetical protein HY586_06430 [Candidatus Omnitrophica bacterium]|nr:hypothetical protein [Candidatus Omnitrophota bacterium]